MTGDYLLDKLLDSFRHSYDVERTCDINGDIRYVGNIGEFFCFYQLGAEILLEEIRRRISDGEMGKIV